ncbi:5-methylcytosine-specific restriction endonuclease system specificity protein McrC [Methanobrevibacter sp. AbM4]|uniref:5-methylcytosine-specific restriction endonuclease system specificity protein McrC n=1 Tax=Methanobrevibacter sp. AbM4 TaxID=224719 RepID=UPI0003348C88|nr:5-methylcytosine-specific restriction endonuclease system specificity protein McrC [Methanobrevibacter sp. AbM4]AGN16994.1 restriction enzyme modulator protein [Methanobrevibacter sp. AbM4]
MIPIKNIYYMLSYAFQVLSEKSYENLGTEEFGNINELFAEILIISISRQIKRGLEKDYIENTDELPTIKGKIELTQSIASLRNKRVVCSYDNFTVDSYKNQIIKSTMYLLLKRAKLSKNRKKNLKRLYLYFKDVSLIDLNTVNWNIQYNKNNQTYRMIIGICYLTSKGLLQNQSEGKTKLIDFHESNMPRLYEKFILEYYKKEYRNIKAESSQIKWQLDDEIDTNLPIMQTDITLTKDYKTVIIDAKYYTHSMQEHYNTKTVHSGNLYQIFTYVKNKEAELSNQKHEVSGILLYAKTDEEKQPDFTYRMSGNRISAKTLDLNQDFDMIKKQLDSIVEEYF